MENCGEGKMTDWFVPIVLLVIIMVIVAGTIEAIGNYIKNRKEVKK